MKKIIALTLVLILAVGLFAGCKSSENKKSKRKYNQKCNQPFVNCNKTKMMY